MARIRTIKPEFWKHEDLSALPEATHLLAAALLNYADDFGYFNANPMLVKSECSPLREPLVSIPESLRSLSAIGYIRLGKTPDGKSYGNIVQFATHQRVSHPTPSKIAELSITWETSGNSPEPLRNPPETFRPEQGKERNREQGREGNREGSCSSLRSEQPPPSISPDWPPGPFRPISEPAATTEEPLTGEERFDALRHRLAAHGVSLKQSGALGNAFGGEWDDAIGVLERAETAANPAAYVAAATRSRKAEDVESNPVTYLRPDDPPDVPGWVIERRELGADIRFKRPPVRGSPRRWVWGNEEYTDDEELVAA